MMMTQPLLLIAPLLIVSAAAIGDSVTLHHSVRFTGPGDTVHLADIATLEGEYATSLGAIEVTAFEAGMSSPLELHVSSVRTAMELHEVHWGRIELHGHRVIIRARSSEHIEPPLAMQPSSINKAPGHRTASRHAMDRSMADVLLDTPTFRGWLARSITNTLGVDAADLKLDFSRDQTALLDASLTEGRFEIKPLNIAMHSERLDYEVRRWEGGRPMSTDLVSVNPTIRTSVASIRVDVQRGRPIAAEHVEHVEQWLTPLQRSGRVAPDAVEGRAAVIRLRAGTILRERDLKLPVLVKRGDKVVVRAIAGGHVLELDAVAESGGTAGEIIELRYGRERKTFTARITARGEAVRDLSMTPPTTIADASRGVTP